MKRAVMWVLVVAALSGATVVLRSLRSKAEREALGGPVSLEDMIGFSLPRTASEVEFYTVADLDPSDLTTISRMRTWAVATISKEDFEDFMEREGFVRRPDLVEEFWGAAFSGLPSRCSDEAVYKLWETKNVGNEDTYFGEPREGLTFIAVKYESGRLYLKQKKEFVAGDNVNVFSVE
jgi:hypothetical protein